MPIHFDILSADGKFLKEAPPATPDTPRFVKSYFMGELCSIIYGQCLQPDFGGVLHLVQDPELISAVVAGENLSELLGEETATMGILPEADPLILPFTTHSGHMGRVALRHIFPETPIVYN